MSETTNRNGNASKPIAIYYEQPNWFVPLFQQLDARGVNWLKLDARYHQYDAASPEQEYSLLFNRMSPSALAARRGAWNFLHGELSEAFGRQGRARGERVAGVHA